MKYLCSKIGLTKEISDYIYSVYNGLTHDSGILEELNTAKNSFLASGPKSDYKLRLESISETTGIHLYTVNLIMVLLCAKNVKQLYDKKKLPEDVYFDSMSDIVCKVNECKKMHGVYGIFVCDWYFGIFSLRTFKLGRLEFEVKPCPLEVYGNYVKKDEILYSCHIPSAGPLTYDSVMDSLKRAYKFFGINDYLVVYCRSWLLYPKHYNVFPAGSNLRMFYDLFDIVGDENAMDNANLWRIFYKSVDTPVEQLPRDTTLQRNFVSYLMDGNYIGTGTGMIVFDGEKIINK